jgi:hypothetical protein
MTTESRIPFRRLATESLVIVASILLAFAIDAWWEERREREAQLERLSRVAAEIHINQQLVSEKIEDIDVAIAGTSEYLSWMGPEPRQVSLEVFAKQWERMIDIGMFSLVRRAVDDYLSSGDPTTTDQAHVRDALLSWYAEADRIEQQYDLLRAEHGKLGDYINTTIPGLHTASTLSVMEHHPRSKFPLNPDTTLSDPTAESLLANYLIRLEFISMRLNDYRDHQTELLDAIRATVDED